jgi:hypothetical protein
MPLTPDQMGAAIRANLPKKTGRTLEEWAELTRAEGPATWKARVDWLKRTHQLGHVQAQFIVWEAEKSPDYVPPTPQELFDAQYAGSKAALRPIYERLAEAVRSLGGDAGLDPRRTYVAMVRHRQFGVIQASTKTRVDLGLVLAGVAPGGRLEKAPASLGSGRITHRIALASPDDVDAEVLGWLRAAYEGGT